MDIRRFYIFLLSLSSIAIASAQSFEVDDMRYQVLSSTEKVVAVVSYSNDSESDNFIGFGEGTGVADVKRRTTATPNTYSVRIPSQIVYNGQTYTVEVIFAGAFRNNSKMSSVIIPSSVVEIGENAFDGCSSLDSVYCYIESPLVIDDNTFGGRECTLIVPFLSVADYSESDVWNAQNIVPFGDLNNNRDLGIADISLLIEMLRGKSSRTTLADLNGDGCVDTNDLESIVGMVLSHR